MVRSKSFAKRRFRLSHAKVRSTGLGGELSDDLYCDGGGVPDVIAIVGTVGIGVLDGRRGRHRFSPCSDAVHLNKMVVETFEYSIVTQSAEPAVDRPPWRKAVR